MTREGTPLLMTSNGFIVLPIRAVCDVTPTPTAAVTAALEPIQYMFMKQHISAPSKRHGLYKKKIERDSDSDSDEENDDDNDDDDDDVSETPSRRTLFVVNVPTGATPQSLADMFEESCGVVNAVHMNTYTGRNRRTEVISLKAMLAAGAMPGAMAVAKKLKAVTGLGVAHVVFEDPLSLQRAMSLKKSEPLRINVEVVAGYRYWESSALSRRLNPNELKQQADTFMLNWENEEARCKKELRDSLSKPDEEGWITVQKGGSRNRTHTSDGKTVVTCISTEQSRRSEEKKRKRDKSEANISKFYGFQEREDRREKVADLRRKFESDKARIATMKEERRFRPY